MDPDANLAEQLDLARRIQRILDTSAYAPVPAQAARFAELVLALDEWIVRGGFLPRRWRR
jgi:hypothetical protein